MVGLLFAGCVGKVVSSCSKIVVSGLKPNRFFTEWVRQINLPGTELPLACGVCVVLAFTMFEFVRQVLCSENSCCHWRVTLGHKMPGHLLYRSEAGDTCGKLMGVQVHVLSPSPMTLVPISA